uniref:Uncharacterized protein n=1 Tax=Cyclopterus lumpus TaxID=8103 RepID=A0A8C2ZYD8_CYCLU
MWNEEDAYKSVSFFTFKMFCKLPLLLLIDPYIYIYCGITRGQVVEGRYRVATSAKTTSPSLPHRSPSCSCLRHLIEAGLGDLRESTWEGGRRAEGEPTSTWKRTTRERTS